MNIVQINAVNHFSSTGRNTSELHEYFKQYGHESHVFCSNESNEADNVHLVGSRFDHKLHALLSRITGRQACFSSATTRRMVDRLRQIRPDAVILGNFHSNYVDMPQLLTYLAQEDVPTIAVMHDCWYFTGHCMHYTAVGCQKWRTECHHCRHLDAGNVTWFVDPSRHMFRLKQQLFTAIPRLAVVGVSKWITNEAAQSPIFANARSFTPIYNWIDLNKFRPRPVDDLKDHLGLTDEFVVLGVAQGWGSHKGIQYFIDLARRHPQIRVILVGSIAERPTLPPNLWMVGATANVDQLAQYYSLANCLLVCSPQETFGKVSAEALSCGTPVIAHNATANPEVADTECGYIIHRDHPDQIDAALSAIAHADPAARAALSQRCITRATNLFNLPTQAQKYLTLIQSLQE